MTDAEGKGGAKRADETGDSGKEPARSSRRTLGGGGDVDQFRTIIARVVWGVCVLFAAVLAIAALAIALGANEDNALVEFVLDFAAGVDLGIFDLEQPIWESNAEDPENQRKITALINYGTGAVAYLIVGRLLEKLIRP